MDRSDKHKRRSPESAALSAKGDVPRSLSQDTEHLVIGQVVGTRGLRGELKIRLETQNPERFHLLDTVYLGDEFAPFQVGHVRLHKNQVLLQLHGIDDIETAEDWREAWVYIHVDDAIPLEEGEYYFYQLRGLAVISEEGESLGTLVEILPTGANDVYVVKGNRGELLLPAIKDTILDVDLENRTMTVRIPDGLG